MKKWKKPVITRVKLDPKQAVMQTCIQNLGTGAWMTNTGTVCVWGTEAGTGASCNTSPRGSFGDGTTNTDPSNAGS